MTAGYYYLILIKGAAHILRLDFRHIGFIEYVHDKIYHNTEQKYTHRDEIILRCERDTNPALLKSISYESSGVEN